MDTRNRGHRAVPLLALATILTLPAAALAADTTSTGDAAKDRTAAVREAVKGGTARNVILLIGDGMGDSEITIARNYHVGASGRLALDRLPLTGAYTTYSVQQAHPELPDYVTDSAASGSAWATGYKTYNHAISVTPDGRPRETILELAKKAGFLTGDVSTGELQDATPAVLAAHVTDRNCKGPEVMKGCPADDKVNGGAGSIAEQMVQTRPDVLLGGGSAYFEQKVQAGAFKGKTVTEQARAAGYRVVTALSEARTDKPVLGAFAEHNLDLEWIGPKPTRTGTKPARCEVNAARPAAQPHLADMASTAIDVLDKRTRYSRKGYFLQIEGASIDKSDHAADPCGQIGETVAFDNAVKLVLDYQKAHPDTLVVVTADHGHTSQIVEDPTLGYTASLITKDRASMTVSYATSVITGSQQHTGTQVRIAAGGPQAANVVGVTDQTDLFHTLRRALGL
jgi:alkaline phosphatase